VAFHETFWVVTGTAAPVIALAAVVSLGEALRQHLQAFEAVEAINWRELPACLATGR
jgi:hypothetical protein